jgi:hypothetical protein
VAACTSESSSTTSTRQPHNPDAAGTPENPHRPLPTAGDRRRPRRLGSSQAASSGAASRRRCGFCYYAGGHDGDPRAAPSMNRPIIVIFHTKMAWPCRFPVISAMSVPASRGGWTRAKTGGGERQAAKVDRWRSARICCLTGR